MDEGKRVLKLYKGAINFTEQAKDGINETDSLSEPLTIRAKNIVCALIDCISDKGGKIHEKYNTIRILPVLV